MLALQPQETTLAPGALHALDDLKRSTISQEKLQGRLSKAVELITQVSAQINDRGIEEKSRYTRKRNKRIASGESEDHDARQENEDYQEKVESLTKKMDASIRQVIDDQVWLQDVPDALDHVRHKAGNAARGTTSTQFTTQHTEDDMDLDDTSVQNLNRNLAPPDASVAPTALLDAAFSTNDTKWGSKSLTDRYSQHNDYVGWYRMVYDAKHPGENAPPMPNASMWFAAEEGRDGTDAPGASQSRRQQRPATRGARAQGNAAIESGSESDIEIAAERVRTRCPITLLPYHDPLASTKCPHAFEKSAILEMFKHSTEQVALTSEQLTELSQYTRPQERSKREREMRIPMVRCPECSVPLTEKDLQPDPVLLRKVKRILEKERRAEEAGQRQGDNIMDAEDDDENDEPVRGTQRRNIVHLGSSPARSVKRQSGQVIKNERQSRAAETQIHDLDD